MKHPNIVRVRYVGEHEGRPFLDMELAGGGNLAQHRERFAADQRSVAKLMVQVARAVHHAHQRRILHRDLKPANILLDSDEDENKQDKPYVTDFGLAMQIGADGFPIDTGSRVSEESQVYQTIAGTVAYMSPEQAEGKDATTLSDVYGLGATMYSLQTGKSPFGASTVKETLRQVRDPGLKPKPPRAIDPHIDRTLEALCLKCLRKDPNDRYASAEGVAKDLERWLAQRPTRARPLSRLGRSRLWRRRNPLGVGLALMILAFLTLAGVIIADIIAEPGRALVALARQNAETLQLRLEQLRQAVGTARDPRLGELLTQRNFTGLQTFIEETGNRRSPFSRYSRLARVVAAEMKRSFSARITRVGVATRPSPSRCPCAGQHLDQGGAEGGRPGVAGLELIQAAFQLARQPRCVQAEMAGDPNQVALRVVEQLEEEVLDFNVVMGP